jgi:hypothetical protein
LEDAAAYLEAGCKPVRHHVRRALHERNYLTTNSGPAHRISDRSADDEDCENTGNPAGSTCSTCASCCIGAFAPPPVFALTALNEAANGVQQFPSSSFIEHIPARIERPPRAADL